MELRQELTKADLYSPLPSPQPPSARMAAAFSLGTRFRKSFPVSTLIRPRSLNLTTTLRNPVVRAALRLFILGPQNSGEAGPLNDFDEHDQCVVLCSKPDQPSTMFFEFSPGRIIFIAVHADQPSHQESEHNLGSNHEEKHGVAERAVDFRFAGFRWFLFLARFAVRVRIVDVGVDSGCRN